MREEYRNKTAPNRCNETQFRGNVSKSIEELYTNIENITDATINVRSNDGATVVRDVRTLIANCMKIEDMSGDTARITPQTASYFKAPSGGISATTTTTVSSAVCEEMVIEDGVFKTTGNTATVYNGDDASIAGDAVFLAHKIQGCVWTTMGCCVNTSVTPGGGGGDPDPEPEPPDTPGASRCGSYILGGTAPQRFDVKFYGFFFDERCPAAPCPVATNGYTIRVSLLPEPQEDFVIPCAKATPNTIVCHWRGVDRVSTTIPGQPGIPSYSSDTTLTVNLFLERFDESSNSTLTRCQGPGVYLSCVLIYTPGANNRATPWEWAFSRKLSDRWDEVIDAAFSDKRIPFFPFNIGVPRYCADGDLFGQSWVACAALEDKNTPYHDPGEETYATVTVVR